MNGKPLKKVQAMEYVSQEEFDRLCTALGARRAIVQAAERKLAKAQTLAQKIEARRELKAARALPVE